MTAVDPEGRIRHPLDVFHSTYAPDGSFIAAGMVPVADGAGLVEYIDSATFGDATTIAELVAAVFGYQAHGNLGATETFSAVTAGWHSGTVNADCTFTFTAGASGTLSSLVLELEQDGTGGWNLTLPGSVVGDFTGYDTTAGSTSLLMFFSRDGGATWYGFIAGGSGTGSALEVLDEGSSLDTAVVSINVVGAGATATNVGHAVTITIPGGATASDTGIWRPLMDGAGNVVTDGGTGEAVMAFS